MMTTDSTVRCEFIAGLRALANFLANNPKVPVPSAGKSITVFPGGTDEEKRTVVDRVAELIGAPASGGDHYKTVRDFGPISYEVLAISEQRMDDHHALMTYEGAVKGGGR
ncbi:hypothetical protein [Nonomuraea sp. SYSU D8015]|uniref:hypothetical protein n=1 Tax=Nonomuraea sp. SYSU D8015 TaxID=2593644 RepID=UPI0016616873|nr:hypothetical protein [Nonomuraea sp. SYSU D8015]